MEMQIKVKMKYPFYPNKLTTMKENNTYMIFKNSLVGSYLAKISSHEKFTDFSTQKFYSWDCILLK